MAADTLHQRDITDAARRMDAMYRRQRHIYDITRKFYLFGRDQLLAALPVGPGSQVLEMGCGTGRNLMKLARRVPDAALFGVDVSTQMLATASAEIRRGGLSDTIRLAQSAGESFDAAAHFGVTQFDVVYFSYVLSMIPDWRPALDRALSLVKPGGVLAIVDFGDQQQAPLWQRRLLLGWLKLFDVHPRAEIEASVVQIARASGELHRWEQIFGGYGVSHHDAEAAAFGRLVL